MRQIFLIVAGLVGLGACQSDVDDGGRQAAQQMNRGARELFEIDLPPDCEVASKGASLDFEVFEITCGDVYYGGLYAGNFADPDVPRSRLLNLPLDWPSEIQVWSASVPEPDQARADQIAASVRLSPLAAGSSRRR